MARDATDTREQLLATAQRLFAREGIYQVPFSRELDTADGRESCRLISQLSMLFDFWDVELPPALDHDAFVVNLVDMAVGALAAPSTTRGA